MANEFNINVESTRPNRIDWSSERNTLSEPSNLGFWTRMRLRRRGRLDASNGLAYVDKEGNFISLYCKTLVDQANMKIEMEWQECDGKMFEIKKHLDSLLHKRELLLENQTKLLGECGQDLERRRNISDENLPISDHLKDRRKRWRMDSVRNDFDNRRKQIENEISQTEMEAIPYINDYRNAEDIAITHESIHRTDYLRSLTEYAYGASRYIRIPSEMINDDALTHEPREKHDKLFADYRRAFEQAFACAKAEDSQENASTKSASQQEESANGSA